MSARIRLTLLILAALVLAPGIVRLAWAMPTFGAHPLPYGDAINAAAPAERLVTNTVTAVNFDYRGFDTLGEEFMLMAAVTGTVVLLRGTRGEAATAKPQEVEGRRIQPRLEALILINRLFAPILLVFGVYVSVHATTTPGGGFQGGVIIASGLLLIYLGEGYAGWRRHTSSRLLDLSEGGGALLFALTAAAPLLFGKAVATNILPLGTFKSAFSGGTMFVDNIGVAFAVTGGFALIFLEFLEETRRREPSDSEGGDDA